jgi:hypothetical protein
MSTITRLEHLRSASPRVIKRLAEVLERDIAELLVLST